MPAHRFPPPWSAEVTPNCFIVRDANGQALSYVYYENEPGRRSAAKLLRKDEARRIASNPAHVGQTLFQRCEPAIRGTAAPAIAIGARGESRAAPESPPP